jgi:flagellar assembly factor FliW
MRTINTRFHGTIALPDSDVLTVDYPILGFPAEREFVLLPHRPDSPFLYLQSIRTHNLAFVAIDPLLRFPDYQVPQTEIPSELGPSSEWAVLCLCTLRNGQTPTMNLKSPLIFNRESRRGGQFVLSLPYPLQYPLIPPRAQDAPEGQTGPEEPSHAGTHP